MKISKTFNYHPYIDGYMQMVENDEIPACQDQKQLMKYLRSKLDQPNVIIDANAIENSVHIPQKYFPYELYPWQKFINAFIYGVRYDNGRLVFNRFFILIGRGAGKNGYMSYNDFYMMTGHLGIQNYDIDLVATSEDQAKTSFEDVYNVLDDPKNTAKMDKAFYKSKVLIKHKKTKSTLRYNTANARTKDGKRSSCIMFDEVHEYDSYDRITVYISGLGKKKDSRIFYITTDGKVRGGVLDDLKNEAQMVLNGDLPKSTMFPFICRIDKKEHADDPKMWPQANPSLPYNEMLQQEMEQQHYDMQNNAKLYMEFYRKRMNFPLDDILSEVATWDERKATDQPLPEIKGRIDAIGGIDYASKKDFCAVGILFKYEGKRYFIHHTFVFRESIKQQGINQEIIDLAQEKGLCTLVDGDNIDTQLLIDWFAQQAKKFNIKKIACDLYRSSILTTKFYEAGFNIEIIRKGPATHAMLAPLVEEVFTQRTIVFPDDPMMRWYIGNVYKHIHTNGNTEYKKVEEVKRKTDGFFAFLHALNFDEEISEWIPIQNLGFGVMTF